ncbi:hypothetical protein BGW80DRAFT_1396568 [Lactifluus volemus]|nr:hypothetical protein BGW80DRAFT_1396568 [Lactifluus volemus]
MQPFEDPFAPPRSCSPDPSSWEKVHQPLHQIRCTQQSLSAGSNKPITSWASRFREKCRNGPTIKLLPVVYSAFPLTRHNALSSPSRPHPTSPLSPERIQVRHLLRHHPYATIALPTTLTSILSRSLQLSICYS